MDPNAWYFTLSSLSQVLAGVLGLTAIFVTVKLDYTMRQIDYHKRRGVSVLRIQSVQEAVDGRLHFDASHILRELKAFAHKHREDPAIIPHLEKVMKKYDSALRVTPERAWQFVDDSIYSLDDNLTQKRESIEALKAPSGLSLLAIIFSFILLSFSDFFLATPYAFFALVGVVGIGLLGTMAIAIASYTILRSVE